MLSREFFYRLEDEINRARYEIDEKYHMRGILALRKALGIVPDTVEVSIQNQGDLSVYKIGDKEITAPSVKPVEEVAADYLRGMNPFERKSRLTVSLKDRLQEKARLASSIVSSEVKALEDGMDAIIAEKDAVAQKREAAVAATGDVLGVVKDQWDSIKSSVDILSNGAPE